MKYLLFAGRFIIIFLMGYTSEKRSNSAPDKTALSKIILKKKTSIISCTPDWTTYHLSEGEIQQMMPLPGTGSHTWKISTKNDSAQFYFNQGINLYYGFHIKWDDIIKQPDVEARLHYALLLQLFAKGMAFANTNNLAMAKSSLAKMETLSGEKDLLIVLTPFNAPITGANIAKYILGDNC